MNTPSRLSATACLIHLQLPPASEDRLFYPGPEDAAHRGGRDRLIKAPELVSVLYSVTPKGELPKCCDLKIPGLWEVPRIPYYFKVHHPVVLFIIQIKRKSVRTQLNSVYYTELNVSTYFRSSSGSQFVFKTY
jgi:hypothetical protein